jgi:capsular exopolysaccharide synthesis family protein
MSQDLKGIDAAAESQAHRDNQLRFFLNVVGQRWKWILLCVVMGLATGWAFGMVMRPPVLRPVWEAATALSVRQSPFDKDIFKGLGATPLFPNTPENLVSRISKRDLAEDTARSLIQDALIESSSDGMLATPDELRARAAAIDATMTLETVKDARQIRVTAAGVTPAEARKIVEYAARAFIRRNQLLMIDEERETREFLQKQIEEVGLALDTAESEEWQFRKEMGFRTFDNLDQEVKNLQEELGKAETAREHTLAKLAEIEQELKQNNENLPSALSQLNDAVVTGLLTELNALLQQQFEMSLIFTEDYPPLQDIQLDIQDKRDAILRAIRQLDGDVISGQNAWDRRLALRDQYRMLQLEVTSDEIRAATIEHQLNDIVAQWPELSSRRQEHRRLSRSVEQFRTQFTKLVDKKTELEQSLGRDAGPVERATPVTEPVMTSTARRNVPAYNAMIGALVGFVIGFGFAFLAEANDTSIRSIEDINRYIGLEVIGTIPRMMFGEGGRRISRRARGTYVAIKDDYDVDPCIVTQHDPKSPISEAYRTLRTNFQLSTIQRKPKSIMVTSAVPGEGKTTTAVNMAVTFADHGYRVLLVDTDLRRPHVHHVLKMERGPGLADVLRHGGDYRSLIRPTRIRNLWTISSGHVPPNPSELIGSNRMQRFIEQMQGRFDLVICDAPSILVVTDPVLLATHVESVIIVVSANNARRETVMRAKRLMETAHASVAGVVLNGLEATRRHYYYYYYYYDDTESSKREKWVHLS